MLVCCVDIYDKSVYKLGELCNSNSHYIWFLYPFSDISEEVLGRFKNGRLVVTDEIYVGLKVRGSEYVTIVRDGFIRELTVGSDFVYLAVFLKDFITPNSYELDFFKVQVGQASKDKLVMCGGKNG